MRRLFAFAAALAVLLSSCLPCSAQTEESARSLKDELILTRSDDGSCSRLLDGKQSTYLSMAQNSSLILQTETAIASLYLEFDRIPGEWMLTDLESGAEYVCGTQGFLHEFVDVSTLCRGETSRLALTFHKASASVAEISAFSAGHLPDSVQRWESMDAPCDLLLVSTHSDDDQLFFAGLIPSSVAQGLEVQVAFFANHWDTHDRPHELLDGLWHAGLARYPLISEFADEYSTSAEQARANLAARGYERDSVLDFQVSLLRRFRPIVVVGHDLKGEYGHGQHMYNAETLTEALELARDEEYVCASAPQASAWGVTRCYLHLYEEHPIVCDYDTPLEFFGGRTAFEVSKEAFGFHKSQHWTWFATWIDAERASDISTYSPCRFGLFYAADGVWETESFFSGLQTHREIEEAQRLAKEEEIRRKEELRREEEEKAKQSPPEEVLPESPDAAVEKELRLWIAFGLFACATLIFVIVRTRSRSKGEEEETQ